MKSCSSYFRVLGNFVIGLLVSIFTYAILTLPEELISTKITGAPDVIILDLLWVYSAMHFIAALFGSFVFALLMKRSLLWGIGFGLLFIVLLSVVFGGWMQLAFLGLFDKSTSLQLGWRLYVPIAVILSGAMIGYLIGLKLIALRVRKKAGMDKMEIGDCF